MDKKNTIIGVLFLSAAFVLMLWTGMDEQKRAAQQAAEAAQAAAAHPTPAGGNATTAATTPTAPASMAPAPAPTAPTAAVLPGTGGLLSSPMAGPAETCVLQNDDIKVTFTAAGGAIQTVALNHFPAQLHGKDPVVFNDGVKQPALELALALPETGGTGLPPSPVNGQFEVVKTSKTNTAVTFEYHSPEGVQVQRTYTILGPGEKGDGYLIASETRFANHGTQPLQLSRLYVSTGVAPPTPGAGYMAGMYLDFGYYNGNSAKFIATSQFQGSAGWLGGVLPIGRRDAQPYLAQAAEAGAELQWVSVKNEFFAAVLTPEAGLHGNGYFTQPVPLMVDGNQSTGITGALEVNLGIVAPGQERALALNYYVGPKEYVRLDALGQQQDLVMEFGMMGGLAKILLVILIWLHSVLVPVAPAWAWGWAIVIFTIAIKTVTWPLTQIQVRSAKRMAQIQKPLAALREKYKDNPQKLQTEMMELFKQNKVNPAAGCVPLLIQLPILFAFFSMMRTASELRFASFLWIHDLSAPDTVGHVLGVSINILPVLMTATAWVQMRLTPTPSTDNFQRQMFQFMPLMMLFFMYTMPSGMVLYWTCQNLLTILQQVITNRMKDPVTAAPAAPTKPAGPAKGLPRPAAKRR